ncbi:transposase family protein [Burkholderia thailandensis 34]|nr:transposase family protein [Burkholderia thailandensis 34]PNE79255.1 hypothetical protein A8H37_11215 [Burkholderia thailandensis]
MQDVTLVGIDLGKHSFHLHGQDRCGKAVFRKKVGRKQLLEFFAKFHACTVVMEACAGAHPMARKLTSFGHRVKLISPQFVRPFVKSNKNDFVDAEAICEAASAYIDHRTRSLARELGLEPLTTPVRSPQSNGMAESFVKTMKHNYVAYMDKSDAPTALSRLAIAFEHYNERHPHKALKYRSPREFRHAAGPSI